MPLGYKTRKTYYGRRPRGRPRKNYENRKSRAIATRYVARGPGRSPFVNNRIFKMRYCAPFVLNPGAAGVLSQHFFSANDLHDPDTTGGGHQPLGYDQLTLLYNHYVVLGSKITVKFNNPTSGESASNVVGIYLSDDVTVTTTDYDQIIEQRRTPYRILPSAIERVVTLSKGFSAKKFFNLKDTKDNLTRVGASFGASPTEEAYFCVWGGSIQKTIDLDAFNCLAIIDYIVAVSEPKELAQS